MRNNKTLLVLGLVALAFTLRVWGIWWFETPKGIESLHIPASINYMKTGQYVPEPWFSPPQNHVFLDTSMKMFGNNLYGWRLRNILLSTLGCLMLILSAHEIFKSQAVALTAGLLYVLDPLEITIARSTYEDPGAVAFFLVFLYCALRYLRGRDLTLPIAGVALGISIAGRWYYASPASLIIVYMLYKRFWCEDRRMGRATYIISSTALLGAAVYIAFFIPWFSRGYGLWDFMPMHFDTLRELRAMDRSTMTAITGESGRPIKWFLWPEIILFVEEPSSALSRILLFMNNPPVWLLTIPASIILFRAAWRGKNPIYALLLACLVLTYFQYLSLNRALFLYTGLSTLPFTALLVGYMVAVPARRFYVWIMGAFVIWSVYIYPLSIGMKVPVSLYAPLRAVAHYVRLGGGM